MTLLERITQALNGTTEGPWHRDGSHILGVDYGEVAQVETELRNRSEYSPNAELIAAAPGLLAECAQRLTTDHDVRQLVADLRRMDVQESARDGCHWGRYGPTAILAADLLEQVFLDPQETNQ